MPFQKVHGCFPLRYLSLCCSIIAHIISQIRFLGGKLGKALAEEYDVSTVGDLLCVFVPYSELYVR